MLHEPAGETPPTDPPIDTTTSSTHRENDNPAKPNHIITLASLTVLGAFFLPWTTFLGVPITGLDVQKGADQCYRLVWIMPFLAFVTLLLNLGNKDSVFVRRLAGVFPFVILGCTLKDTGVDLFKVLSYGAWLGLLGAAALILLPRNPSSPKKASS